jgi:hypothetical protein
LVSYFRATYKTVDDIELTVKEILRSSEKGWCCSQIYFDFDGVVFENLEVSITRNWNAVAAVLELKEGFN